MAELQLDPQKTALVLIDLQNAVLGMTPAPHSADKVVETFREARERFPRRGHPSCIRASLAITFIPLALPGGVDPLRQSRNLKRVTPSGTPIKNAVINGCARVRRERGIVADRVGVVCWNKQIGIVSRARLWLFGVKRGYSDSRAHISFSRRCRQRRVQVDHLMLSLQMDVKNRSHQVGLDSQRHSR